MEVKQNSTQQNRTEIGDAAYPGTTFSFTTLPTQVAVKNIRHDAIEPVNPILPDAPVNFKFMASNNECLDLQNSYLVMTMSVTTDVNAAVGDGAAGNVTIVNGIGHAFWRNITVRINGEVITNSDHMYAYRGDLATRLTYDTKVKTEGSLSQIGWDEEFVPIDDYANADAVLWHNNPNAHAELNTSGMKRRHHMYTRVQDNVFRIESPIHADIFNQSKFLPPGTTVEVIFERNANAFCLLSKIANATFRLHLRSMQLMIRYVKMDPEVLHSQLTYRAEGHRMLFPLRRVAMTCFTKPNGSTDWSEPHLLYGQGNFLPRRLFLALVPQVNFTGSYGTDPFNYVGGNLSEVAIRLNGETKPYPILRMNRGRPEDADDHEAHDTRDWTEPVSALLRTCNSYLNPHFDIGINRLNYHHRNWIMGFDLSATPELDGKKHYELPDDRQLSLHMLLTRPTEHVHTLIVMAEYDAELTIDSEGKVKLSENALE